MEKKGINLRRVSSELKEFGLQAKHMDNIIKSHQLTAYTGKLRSFYKLCDDVKNLTDNNMGDETVLILILQAVRRGKQLHSCERNLSRGIHDGSISSVEAALKVCRKYMEDATFSAKTLEDMPPQRDNETVLEVLDRVGPVVRFLRDYNNWEWRKIVMLVLPKLKQEIRRQFLTHWNGESETYRGVKCSNWAEIVHGLDKEGRRVVQAAGHRNRPTPVSKLEASAQQEQRPLATAKVLRGRKPRRSSGVIQDKACYTCGEPGHFARNCPKRFNNKKKAPPGLAKEEQPGSSSSRGKSQPRATSAGETKCYNCGGRGHWASVCPSQPKGDKGRPRQQSKDKARGSNSKIRGGGPKIPWTLAEKAEAKQGCRYCGIRGHHYGVCQSRIRDKASAGDATPESEEGQASVVFGTTGHSKVGFRKCVRNPG